MPNRDTHIFVGALAGGTRTLFQEAPQDPNDHLAVVLGGIVGGMVGARLPDVLDPPCSPNHRACAHAIVPVSAAAIPVHCGLNSLANWLRVQAESAATSWERYAAFFLEGFVKGLGPGYLSHLLLDGCTPQSLPLLGREIVELVMEKPMRAAA